MRTQRVRFGKCQSVTLILLGMLLACAPSGTRQDGRRPNADAGTASRLISEDLLTNDWNEDVSVALTAVVSTTVFEGRWQINKQPRKDYLNVFILRGRLGARVLDLPPEADGARGNCAAAGSPNLVFCDSEFLTTFLRRAGVDATTDQLPNPSERRQQYRRAFLLWLLGHETAHVIFGDGASHFQQGALEAEVSNLSLDHRKELKADSFSIARLAGTAAAGEVVGLVIDLLNAEIRRKVGDVPAGVGILFDYNNTRVVEYSRLGSHPEFVVRGARLLQVASESGDTTFRALKAMVDPFIRHMREAGR